MLQLLTRITEFLDAFDVVGFFQAAFTCVIELVAKDLLQNLHTLFLQVDLCEIDRLIY